MGRRGNRVHRDAAGNRGKARQRVDVSRRNRIHQLANLPRHRILVVDDVEASATTMAMLLRAIGQDVEIRNDGMAALDWLATGKPDVVFLDISMPGMDGYEVARRIRALPRLNDVVLVALTGYGQEEDRRMAFDAGFNHHLVKPVSIDALEQLLEGLPVARDGATAEDASERKIVCPRDRERPKHAQSRQGGGNDG